MEKKKKLLEWFSHLGFWIKKRKLRNSRSIWKEILKHFHTSLSVY